MIVASVVCTSDHAKHPGFALCVSIYLSTSHFRWFCCRQKFINYMVAELTTAYNVRKMLPFIREDGNEHKKNNTHRTRRNEYKKKKWNITHWILRAVKVSFPFVLYSVFITNKWQREQTIWKIITFRMPLNDKMNRSVIESFSILPAPAEPLNRLLCSRINAAGFFSSSDFWFVVVDGAIVPGIFRVCVNSSNRCDNAEVCGIAEMKWREN